MQDLKSNLSNEIKLKLGIIIREIRKYKYLEKKDEQYNPYTKENICIDICHLNTLSKLEKEAIKRDRIYYSILERLHLSLGVNEDGYLNNYQILLNYIFIDLINDLEFKNKEQLLILKSELCELDYTQDCLNQMNQLLLVEFINYKLTHEVNPEIIQLIIGLFDYFEPIFLSFAKHFVGIYYLYKREFNLAKNYLLEAKELYVLNNIHPGIVNDDLIRAYESNNNILESVQLSTEMEVYYLEKKNYKRLIHVYTILAKYYLMINANDKANDYYNLVKELSSQHKSLTKETYPMDYHFALKHFRSKEFDKALPYANSAYYNCNDINDKLTIINLLLMVYTITNSTNIHSLIQDGKNYLEYASEFDQLHFRYFVYKFENKDYYRKFASEKVIPFFKKFRNKKEFLIFIYEDLYEL